MFSDENIREATERAAKRRREEPRVLQATYDSNLHRIVLLLSDDTSFSFSPGDAQMLEDAQPAQLGEIEVLPVGYGIHFPQIDADFSLPGMLAGRFGTRRWMDMRQASGRGTPQGTLSKVTPGTAGSHPHKLAVAS